MITEYDFNSSLIEIMSEQHKKILIDFTNNFLETFCDCITKEEILERINKLKYIGFERQENIDERCNNADAEFISSSQKIIISKRHKSSDEKVIKSLLYHELIHAISYHSEKNLDSSFNQYMTNRTGLNREIVEFDSEYDGPGFNEGELLEEIMTEYYNTVLLKKEGIDFNGISVLNNYCFDQDYVEYHGTGYYNIAALGQIYDYLFGKDLMMAKLHDGNEFRRRFNELFDNTEIFAEMFSNEEFKVPSYSKFVAQRNTMGRYQTACKIFIELFKKENKHKINNINDLLKNSDFEKFLNMLVKTKNRFDESTKVNEELYMIIKNLEKNIVSELLGISIKEDEYGIDTESIETSIFLALEKIYNENNNIDLSNIKYAIFYDNHFKGIYLLINNEKYIIDYRTIGQDISYGKLVSFSELGFSKDDIDSYSKEFKMDISNADFTTIINPVSRMTFIVNNGKLYNHYGEEIKIENLKVYSSTAKENQNSHTR